MDKLTKCFIFDIDNTVALRGTRHQFDFTKVSEDTIKPNIAKVFLMLLQAKETENIHFIFITGRNETCRKDTERWLSDNGFYYDALYMRPEDNKEQDARLKLQIYRERIQGMYEVIAVFEDSARCTEMYRKHLGLTVFQVDESPN